MTRKDYELIAKVLREERPEKNGNIHYDVEIEKWGMIVIRFSQYLSRENERFSPEKFREACLK